LILLSGALVACGATGGPGVYRAPDPSADERYCAWFGEAGGEVLYFGQAAFWSAFRDAGDDARADLRRAGPRLIGRFDLVRREFLEPLDLGGTDARSGVWDVLPVAERVYFTSYFEDAGYVDLSDGSVTIFGDTLFWNEIAPGPPGRLLVSRYADAAGGGGAVLEISLEGEVLAEHSLEAPEGVAYAAKSPAWDPVRDEIWVTTDQLPLPAADDSGTPFAHPTIVLDRQGVEVARVGTASRPAEIQFVRFDARGRGFLSVSEGGALDLVMLGPEDDRREWPSPRRVRLDDAFTAQLDFAQDIQPGPDGSVLVTRWSGRIHRVSEERREHEERGVHTWTLPHPKDSLYYTGVAAGDGVCATRCGDVEVVCSSAPGTSENGAGKR
jgi:hypothetical protein